MDSTGEKRMFNDNETTVGLPTVPGIPVPIPAQAPPATQPVNVYAALNILLAEKSITAIVRSRKIEFRCIRFRPLPGDWLECTVDDPTEDELKIVVKGWTPIQICIGAHEVPFTVQ